VGCGDDGGSITADDSPTTAVGSSKDAKSGSDHDKLVDAMLKAEDNFMDEKEADCVADSVDGKLSDKGFTMLSNPDAEGDLTDLSDDDADAIVKAFDDCIEIDKIADLFSQSFASSAGFDLTDDELGCAADNFVGKYDGAGQFIMAMNQMSEDDLGSATLDMMASCISDDSITSFMAAQLSGQGLDDATAQCVASGLVESVGAQELFRSLSDVGTGGDSSALEAATQEATLACVGPGADVTVPSIGGGIGGSN
jgi:hypothetical protein